MVVLFSLYMAGQFGLRDVAHITLSIMSLIANRKDAPLHKNKLGVQNSA